MHALPHSVPLSLQQATANPRLCWRLLDTQTPQASLGQSLEGSLLLSPGFWWSQGFVCVLQESVSPVLGIISKFWWIICWVNGDLLQEDLCYTHVCCTQRPCPCGSPLLTGTSAGDTQTFKGRSGSASVGSPGVHKVLFEPSGHLWWVWDLILNMISPLLPWKSWRTWNNRVVPNQERSTSRLYIATLLI